jgi:hypothetical protein
VVPGSLQQAGRAHRAFPVAAHHDGRLVGQIAGPRSDLAEFDVHGAGQVSGDVFGVLPDVQNMTTVELAGWSQRDMGGFMAGRGPRCHRSVEFPGDVVIPDFGGLPSDLGGILVFVAHDDQRTIGGRQPAQPAGENRTQGIRDGPRYMRGAEPVDGTCVDEYSTVGQMRANHVDTQRRQRGFAIEQGWADAVDLAEPAEIRRIAAQ